MANKTANVKLTWFSRKPPVLGFGEVYYPTVEYRDFNYGQSHWSVAITNLDKDGKHGELRFLVDSAAHHVLSEIGRNLIVSEGGYVAAVAEII